MFDWMSLAGDEVVKRKKIVVVDDEQVNVNLVKKNLNAQGYDNVISTTNSAKALDLIAREEPDLLMLDIMMPDVSGLDLLKGVRASTETSYTPVIILTASTDQGTKQTALDLGATEFLNKPLDVKDLIPRVRNALVNRIYQQNLKLASELMQCENAQRAAVEVELRNAKAKTDEAFQDKTAHLQNLGREVRGALQSLLNQTDLLRAELDNSEHDGGIDQLQADGRQLLCMLDGMISQIQFEAHSESLEAEFGAAPALAPWS